MRFSSSCSLIVLFFLSLSSLHAQDDGKAAAVFKPLAEHFDDPKSDREKLRQELLVFHRTYPGTPHALQAARLLAQLPSPLDKLDPKVIPALERFDWQAKELVALLGEHRGRQGGAVSAVAYRPDGKMIASGSTNGLVRIWDPTTMRQQHLLGNSYAVNALAFDREGKRLASAGSDGNVRIWEVSGEKPVMAPIIHASSSALYAIVFSADGQRLAVGGADTSIRIFDLTIAKPEKPLHILGVGQGEITGLAYSPRGETLYSTDNRGALRLWDVSVAEPTDRVQVEAHPKGVTTMTLDPKGQTVAVTGADGAIITWRLGAGKPTKGIQFQHVGVRALAFSPGGGTLASASNDRTTILWDLTKSPPPKRAVLDARKGPFDGHISPATAVAFEPQGRFVVTGSADWTVRLWPLSGSKPAEPEQTTVTRAHLSLIYTTAFAPDSQTFASGSYDGTTRIWTLTGTEPKERSLLRGDSAAIYSVTFAPDGRTLASGGGNSTFRLWDAVLGRELRKFEGHPTSITSLQFSGDGRQILCTSGKELWLWDPNVNGKALRRMEGHELNITSADLSADGKHVLSCSGYYLLDKTGRPVMKDGKYLYTDATMRLWDAAKGKEMNLVKHEAAFARAAFAPDGRGLSSAWDGANRMWDLTGAEPRVTGALQGRGGYATWMAASPDSTKLATRWSNGVVVIWDLDTGKSLQEWNFPESVYGLSWASDSRHLAIGYGTGVINILRLSGPKSQ